jgi:hypothetical protein
VYLGLGCLSNLICRDHAKCSVSSRSSCVNCLGESCGAEGRVGRAGDGAAETGCAGEIERAGGGGDKGADGSGGSGKFEQAADGSGGGGSGGVERTGRLTHA